MSISPMRPQYILFVGQRGGYKNFTPLVKTLTVTEKGKELQLICASGGELTPGEKVNGIELQTEGKVVAIDGKSLRRSFDNAHGKKPLHMVSPCAADVGIVLGLVQTEQKFNKISAIPELLEMLDLGGTIFTIDGMGCQKSIATRIRKKALTMYLH